MKGGLDTTGLQEVYHGALARTRRSTGSRSRPGLSSEKLTSTKTRGSIQTTPRRLFDNLIRPQQQ